VREDPAILVIFADPKMKGDTEFRIAVLPGDGIGIEVMQACLEVLSALCQRVGGFRCAAEYFPGGAAYYRDSGVALPDETVRATQIADAILFGAMGLPHVRLPDGTEINPQIDIRFELDLYAGVRPVRALRGGPRLLADPRAQDIDLIVVREQSEGMFVDFHKGKLDDDLAATDRCMITRAGTERVVDFAFRLAERRCARGEPRRVTCVDKANVMTSMAFFRKIFDERRQRFPHIAADHLHVDAAALNLVRQPWTFDVLVTENLFGDILSDLAAGLIGGMGMAPSADIGDNHAMFQPCHGSAPDIAGSGKANPTAMFLSAAMMLEWLGERHSMDACLTAARHLREAISRGFADGRIRPTEFGGPDGTAAITHTVIDILTKQAPTDAPH
jgi:3-isopropylmalate dehydrogenase